MKNKTFHEAIFLIYIQYICIYVHIYIYRHIYSYGVQIINCSYEFFEGPFLEVEFKNGDYLILLTWYLLMANSYVIWII